MKIMVRIISRGACPKCGHKQFVISESQLNTYLTDRDGNIVDSKENSYTAVGMCVNCNNCYPMLATTYGFIPMTSLRKLLYEYDKEKEIIDEPKYISNPMSEKEGE